MFSCYKCKYVFREKKEMKTIKFVDYMILVEHFTEIQCTIILVFQRNMRLKNVFI